MKEYKIIFILILILLIYLIYKNNKTENFQNKEFKEIDLSNFKQYEDWVKNNKSELKTFKNGQNLTDYFNQIRNDNNLPVFVKFMLKSKLLENLENIKLDNTINLLDFYAYTLPSITLKLNFNLKKQDDKGLYIKYKLYKKNGEEINSSMIYHREFINTDYKSSQEILTKFLEGNMKGEIGFEKKISLDGQDGYNDLGDDIFNIEREFYLNEGSYKLDIIMLSNDKSLLTKIKNLGLNINLYKNKDLNESIQNIKKKFGNSIKEIEDKNKYTEDFMPKLYLQNKLDDINSRLILDIKELNEKDENSEIKIDDKITLVVTKNKEKYYYYKLVIVILLYNLNIYYNLKDNDELFEILDDEGDNIIEKYESDLYTKVKLSPTEPTEYNDEDIKAIRDIENTIPEAQGNSEGIDINFEKMLDFYKKDTDKYTTLNNLDNDFPTIIKSLYSKIKELSKFGEEKDITLKHSFTTTFDFDYVFDDYLPVVEEVPLYPLLDNLTPVEFTKKIVELIKKDLADNFGSKRNFSELLNEETIRYLKHLYKYNEIYLSYKNSKVKPENFKELEFIHNIRDVILDLIEQLNFEELNLDDDDGKLGTVIELINLSLKDYGKDGELEFIKIDAIQNNPSFSDLPSEIENFENIEKKKYIVTTEGSEHRREILNKLNELRKKSKQKRNKPIKKFNFFKKNNVSDSIEEFENMDLHKHTSRGQIRFNKNLDIDNDAWYFKDENKSLVSDFSYVDQDNKDHILGSLDSIERNLVQSNEIVQSLVDSYAEFIPGSLSNQVKASIEVAENDLNKTMTAADHLKYQNKEIQQEERIKGINQSIQELEQIQNKIYSDNRDEFKSIKSFGDGQVLSIENMGKNSYNIKVNEGCLEYDKMGVQVSPCSNSKSQRFIMNNIPNFEENNELLKKNKKPLVTQYSDIKYPFQTLNPVLNQNYCLNIEGNSIGVNECDNSKFQRWDAFKSEKNCEDNINI